MKPLFPSPNKQTNNNNSSNNNNNNTKKERLKTHNTQTHTRKKKKKERFMRELRQLLIASLPFYPLEPKTTRADYILI